jgi:hypothetical protein
MKQYIMGMLTGASLILCAVMFIGASDNNSNYGKYQMTHTDLGLRLLDTATGQVYKAKKNTSGGGYIWDEYSTKPKFLFKPWN